MSNETEFHGDKTEGEQDPEAETSKAEQLRVLMESEGVETQVVEIPGGVEFTQAVIFPHSYQGSEPLVRVYRGIHQLDATLLDQVPYAMRSREKDADGIRILRHAKEAVETLANYPTYENLLAYVDTVWPDLSDTEISRFEEDLESIEDGVLEGRSLRLELVFKTFNYTGGAYTDAGLPPYISASTRSTEAAAYGRGGVMILDVPLSKVEALIANSDREVAMKGGIPKEYITAILPRVESGENSKDEIARAMLVVDAESKHTVLADSEVDAQFRVLRDRERAEDSEHHEHEVQLIRERRSQNVLRKFPDARPTDEAVASIREQEQTDLYTAAKRAIYDKLADRYEAAGRSREYLEESMIFATKLDAAYHTVDIYYMRDAVTDAMLQKLRDVVVRQEDYFNARKKRDELRNE